MYLKPSLPAVPIKLATAAPTATAFTSSDAGKALEIRNDEVKVDGARP